MKNIFLTGEIGVGKSYIIDRVLAYSGVKTGGFRTFFKDRQSPDRTLLMMDMDREIARDILRFKDGAPPEVNTACFDEYGTELLGRTQLCKLMVMDELGRFEKNAELFKAAVFNALDGSLPVLGVLRMDAHGWLDDIRIRPDVEVIEVSLQNRDSLPALVAQKLALPFSADMCGGA